MQELITKINALLSKGYVEVLESDTYEAIISNKEEYMPIPSHLFYCEKESQMMCYLEGLLRGLELSVMDKVE